MFAMLLPVLFIAIATFAVAAILDSCLRYGRQARALHAQLQRANVAVECRWSVAKPTRFQLAQGKLMERPLHPAVPAASSARRVAA